MAVQVIQPHEIRKATSVQSAERYQFDHDQFWANTKRLVGRMASQPNNRFVFCVVVVEFAVNGNQAL